VREDFTQSLRKLGYRVLPSQTNFVLVDTGSGQNTKKILEKLEEAKVFMLPPWDEEFTDLPDRYIRFVIGKEEEMRQVVEVLERLNDGGGPDVC